MVEAVPFVQAEGSSCFEVEVVLHAREEGSSYSEAEVLILVGCSYYEEGPARG